MKKLMILTSISSLLFSLNVLAANSCQIGGVTVQSGGSGCQDGFKASCSNGTVTFDSDSQGNAISCGGISAQGGAKPKINAKKLLKK